MQRSRSPRAPARPTRNRSFVHCHHYYCAIRFTKSGPSFPCCHHAIQLFLSQYLRRFALSRTIWVIKARWMINRDKISIDHDASLGTNLHILSHLETSRGVKYWHMVYNVANGCPLSARNVPNAEFGVKFNHYTLRC